MFDKILIVDSKNKFLFVNLICLTITVLSYIFLYERLEAYSGYEVVDEVMDLKFIFYIMIPTQFVFLVFLFLKESTFRAALYTFSSMMLLYLSFYFEGGTLIVDITDKTSDRFVNVFYLRVILFFLLVVISFLYYSTIYLLRKKCLKKNSIKHL